MTKETNGGKEHNNTQKKELLFTKKTYLPHITKEMKGGKEA